MIDSRDSRATALRWPETGAIGRERSLAATLASESNAVRNAAQTIMAIVAAPPGWRTMTMGRDGSREIVRPVVVFALVQDSSGRHSIVAMIERPDGAIGAAFGVDSDEQTDTAYVGLLAPGETVKAFWDRDE